MHMRQDGEASVEEILESIKKVIARDNHADALDQRRRRETEGMPEPADDDEAEEVLDLGSAEFVEEDAADERPDEDDEDLGTPLANEAVSRMMRENFTALAMLAEPGAQPQIVKSGETSLEGLVREMLRPMLAEWLDKNLPPIVERLVRAEIARIAGKQAR